MVTAEEERAAIVAHIIRECWRFLGYDYWERVGIEQAKAVCEALHGLARDIQDGGHWIED
jgi:hypothetical protein